MSKLKRYSLVFLLLLLAFAGYVEIVNRNSPTMTYRQKLLKAVYPALMWFTKLTGKKSATASNEKAAPQVSFYTLKSQLNNGKEFDFSQLKGKKVLIVNTASDCGYTNQYDDLQHLHEQYNDKLIILGFPANDFKQQEKGSDEEIAEFCKLNFGVSFPLMKKSRVNKGAAQNEIFQWLTDKTRNGWNDRQPTWNFCKYIVDENGKLTHFFASSIHPMNKEVLKAIVE